jgi:hypothetical protein
MTTTTTTPAIIDNQGGDLIQFWSTPNPYHAIH